MVGKALFLWIRINNKKKSTRTDMLLKLQYIICYTIYELDISDYLLKVFIQNFLFLYLKQIEIEILKANNCAKPHVNTNRCYII